MPLRIPDDVRCYCTTDRQWNHPCRVRTNEQEYIMTVESAQPVVPARGATTTRQRILTGDRPTGKLHVGHYVGSLSNRVRLQYQYDCFFLVADYHMLTTRLDRLGEIEQNINDLVLDSLSVG